MRELLRRLKARPFLAVELIVGSLFINTLALGQPMFVSQVLNRYIAHEVDATLFTLVIGVLMAMLLEFVFRQNRAVLAQAVSAERDSALGRQGFAVLTRAKTAALDQVPPEIRREVANGTASIEAAYNAGTIATLMDVPFSLLFIGVLYLITPPLALVAAGFRLFAFLTGVLNSRAIDRKTSEMQKESGVGSALLGTALREGDTIRCFNAGGFLGRQWQSHIQSLQSLRRLIASRQNLVQTLTQSTNGLMGVVIIGWGAPFLVVRGALDVGGLLIGCNILASKAL